MKKPTKNPYETLGIPRTATIDQIKRARRRKARLAHPDKGGSQAEMSELNSAADILLNPEQRLLFDQTGHVQSQNIDQQVLGLVMEAFMDSLVKDAKHCLNHARTFIKNRHSEITANDSQARSAKRKLLEKRSKIKTKPGKENLFHSLIDQQLLQAEAAISLNLERTGIIEKALRLLSEYESDEDLVGIAYTLRESYGIHFGGSATTG